MASILVVDDEQSMREFLEILLRKEGHEVETEADAAAAIARAQAAPFDPSSPTCGSAAAAGSTCCAR
jgi:two-component system response regulator PilR (NtrC family)